MSAYDVLVVGAGLAGSTIAERCAGEFGANVLLIDRRPHLAGNCHDPIGDDGLQYHQYGPHIFHTNAEHVVRYLSAFTAWRPYEHRVLANIDGRLVPIPINQTTINALYGLDLDERYRNLRTLEVADEGDLRADPAAMFERLSRR